MTKRITFVLFCLMGLLGVFSCGSPAPGSWRDNDRTVILDIAPTGWTALYLIHGTDMKLKRFEDDPRLLIPKLGLEREIYWCYEQYSLKALAAVPADSSLEAGLEREQVDPPGGWKHYAASAKRKPDGSCVMTVTLKKSMYTESKRGGLFVILWVRGNTYRWHYLSEEMVNASEQLRIEVSADRIQ
jgi:hypothetical protein